MRTVRAHVRPDSRAIQLMDVPGFASGESVSLRIDGMSAAGTGLVLQVFRPDRATLLASVSTFATPTGHPDVRTCTVSFSGSAFTSWATSAAMGVDTDVYVVLRDDDTVHAACMVPFVLLPPAQQGGGAQ